MTTSPHYTDHLSAALRCLDEGNLRLLADGIGARLPQQDMTTLEKFEALIHDLEALGREIGKGYEARRVDYYRQIYLKLVKEKTLEEQNAMGEKK